MTLTYWKIKEKNEEAKGGQLDQALSTSIGCAYIVEKEIGETPLECLERLRTALGLEVSVPMTYAGRLDPLASGQLIILVGDECLRKDTYLGLDKEYVIEVLFGVETDTGDVLGRIVSVHEGTISEHIAKEITGKIPQFIGKITQTYPMYSSKTVNGKPLHEYAREGNVPEVIPTREVTIYSISIEGTRTLSASEVAKQAIENIHKVNGDFRQADIVKDWEGFVGAHEASHFFAVTLRVKCSSGTYMRTLARDLGKALGAGALACRIQRTAIYI